MLDLRKLSDEETFAVRKQVIRLIEQGKERKEIEKDVGVYQTRISQIVKLYEEGGTEGLRPKQRGRKKNNNQILVIEEEKEIRKIIINKTPDQYKFGFVLWTREAIRLLIKEIFGKNCTLQTISNYMKKWGFTCQRPTKRASSQDVERVQHFMNCEYPEIVKKAKEENAQIFWGDETGINNQPFNQRGYSLKGVKPVLKIEAKREKINMISAISNQGNLRFMCYEENMTQQLLIEFMRRLVRSTNRKIFLILDNLKVHHGRIVKKWLSEHKDEIEVFYLPPYSPELNPDEYLNNALKQSVHKGIPPKTKQDLKHKTHKFMRTLLKNTNQVLAFFRHEKVAYQLSTF